VHNHGLSFCKERPRALRKKTKAEENSDSQTKEEASEESPQEQEEVAASFFIKGPKAKLTLSGQLRFFGDYAGAISFLKCNQ
jgi:hypothetical protein